MTIQTGGGQQMQMYVSKKNLPATFPQWMSQDLAWEPSHYTEFLVTGDRAGLWK